MDSRAGHHFSPQLQNGASDFSGLDFSKPGRQEVHFAIARDCRKISNARGFCRAAKAGAVSFHGGPEVRTGDESARIRKDRRRQKQWAMAIHDVSLKFTRDIKAKTCRGWTGQAHRMRIHGATPEWVEQLKKQELRAPGPRQLIAFGFMECRRIL